MQEVFLKLIEQLNSSVFLLLLMLVLVVWIAIFSTKHITRMQERSRTIDEYINTSEKKSEERFKILIEVKTIVDLIRQNTTKTPAIGPGSPMTLTEVGKEIVKNIEANTILERHIEKLEEIVSESNPMNAYDIQTVSIKASRERLIKLLDENELIKVKKEAYKKGMMVEDVLSVFGILLRNHILNKKEISISDVDEHEPSRN